MVNLQRSTVMNTRRLLLLVALFLISGMLLEVSGDTISSSSSVSTSSSSVSTSSSSVSTSSSSVSTTSSSVPTTSSSMLTSCICVTTSSSSVPTTSSSVPTSSSSVSTSSSSVSTSSSSVSTSISSVSTSSSSVSTSSSSVSTSSNSVSTSSSSVTTTSSSVSTSSSSVSTSSSSITTTSSSVLTSCICVTTSSSSVSTSSSSVSTSISSVSTSSSSVSTSISSVSTSISSVSTSRSSVSTSISSVSTSRSSVSTSISSVSTSSSSVSTSISSVSTSISSVSTSRSSVSTSISSVSTSRSSVSTSISSVSTSSSSVSTSRSSVSTSISSVSTSRSSVSTSISSVSTSSSSVSTSISSVSTSISSVSTSSSSVSTSISSVSTSRSSVSTSISSVSTSRSSVSTSSSSVSASSSSSVSASSSSSVSTSSSSSVSASSSSSVSTSSSSVSTSSRSVSTSISSVSTTSSSVSTSSRSVSTSISSVSTSSSSVSTSSSSVSTSSSSVSASSSSVSASSSSSVSTSSSSVSASSSSVSASSSSSVSASSSSSVSTSSSSSVSASSSSSVSTSSRSVSTSSRSVSASSSSSVSASSSSSVSTSSRSVSTSSSSVSASSSSSVSASSSSSVSTSSSSSVSASSSSSVSTSSSSVSTSSSSVSTSISSVSTSSSSVSTSSSSVSTSSSSVSTSSSTPVSTISPTSASSSTVVMSSSSVISESCGSQNCKNGGRCESTGDEGPHCICPPGFDASDSCDENPCFWNRLYPFGDSSGDQEIPDDEKYNSECQRLELDDELYFKNAIYNELYICRNGVIQFSPWLLPYPFKLGSLEELDDHPMIAPYWSDVDDTFAFKRANYSRENGEFIEIDILRASRVYYHVYTNSGVLGRATDDVKDEFDDMDDFEAERVVVVTWVNLYPYVWDPPQDKLYFPSKNTFQAVLVSDSFVTFVMFRYPCGNIQWSAPDYTDNYDSWVGAENLPVAGWFANYDNDAFYNIPGSGDVIMFRIDEVQNGQQIFQLQDSYETWPSELQCRRWHSYNTLGNYQGVVEPCPCTFISAFLDFGFRMSEQQWNCFISRRAFPATVTIDGEMEDVILRQRCCYATNFWAGGALLRGEPNGGHLVVGRYAMQNANNVITDAEAYQICCVQSIQFCHLFYEVRPSDTCQGYRPPFRMLFFGDPHLLTIDGRNYTFNGLGEYTMLDHDNGSFIVQARTGFLEGTTTATAFIAGVVQELNSSKVEARVKDGGGLDVLIDGVTYSGYSNLTNQSVGVDEGLLVSKPAAGCLEVSCPSGAGVKFCEKNNMLSIVVTTIKSFLNKTKGLLGTYNGNTADDFTTPNGAVLQPANDSEVHFDFGLKWQVTAEQSLFTYGVNESVATFRNDTYVPMFLDSLEWSNDSLRIEAENRCNGDASCLFDAAATKDVSIGAASLEISVNYAEETKKLENFPPEFVNAPGVINVTVGETFTLIINAEDKNGDSITITVLNKPPGATPDSISGSSLTFTWTVDSLQRYNLTFVAKDASGASAIYRPTITICACGENSTSCKEPKTGDPLNTDNKFIIKGCECKAGYDGRFCEKDLDACSGNGQACYPGVACIDEEAPANASGFTCASCPTGYAGDGKICSDINECSNQSLNQCIQKCANAPGSYVCSCTPGYTLNSDGYNCDDVDECSLNRDDCMQTCNNNNGGFTCGCNEYFQLSADNKTCEAQNSCNGSNLCSDICYLADSVERCACNKSFELHSDNVTCIDKDECKVQNGGCAQMCNNTNGGFACNCGAGYTLVDSFTCKDINECLDSNLYNCTGEYQQCENKDGGYNCVCIKGRSMINGTCQIPPTPMPTTPGTTPQTEGTKQSLNVSLADTTLAEWNNGVESKFKKAVAEAVNTHCGTSNTSCGARRSRRSTSLFTENQVILLAGYPKQLANTLLVAFFVENPPGYGVAILPIATLYQVVSKNKANIEGKVGKTLTVYRPAVVPTTVRTTEVPTSPTKASSDTWKWILIGVLVGVLIIVIVIIVVVVVKRKRASKIGDLNHNRDGTPTIPDVEEGEVVQMRAVRHK